jgi:hypothetical protein
MVSAIIVTTAPVDINAVACSYENARLEGKWKADQHCRDVTQNQQSECVPPVSIFQQSVCTKGPDSDAGGPDGLGDACDNCPQVYNTRGGPDVFVQGTNCNVWSERVQEEENPGGALHYPYIGDACDREPCTYFDATWDKSSGQNFQDAWVEFDYKPILLNRGAPVENGQTYDYTGSPTATVGGRWCRCDKLDVWTCYKEGTCSLKDSGAAYNLHGWNTNWQVPHLAATGGASQYVDEFSFPSASAIGQSDQFLSATSTMNHVYWHVGMEPGAGFTPGGGAFNFTLPAVYWTHVVALQNTTPAVVAELPNHYRATLWGRPGSDVSENIPTVPIGPGELEEIKCPHCPQSIDQSVFELDPIDQKVYLRANDFALDITAGSDPALVSTLTSATGARWLTVEEPRGLRAANGMRFAAVSSDATAIPAVVAETPLALALVGRRPSGGVAALVQGFVGEPVGPTARSQFGALLSDTEGGVLIVGGLLANDTPAREIWQYLPIENRWVKIPVQGTVPGRVLATAYSRSDRVVFVLDELQFGPVKWARLIKVELGAGHASMIGLWPRRKLIDRVFMTVGPNGELVILGSSTSKKRYYGVLLNASFQGLNPAGGVIGKGAVSLRPTLTVRGLTVPIEGPDRVVNDFVPSKQLHLHPHPGPGDCL